MSLHWFLSFFYLVEDGCGLVMFLCVSFVYLIPNFLFFFFHLITP